MSIRAHRIIEIKRAEISSFSVWQDNELRQFLDENTTFSSNLNSDGVGMTEVPIKVLEKAIKMAKNLNITEEAIKRLQEDIEFAKSNKDDFIIYECF